MIILNEEILSPILLETLKELQIPVLKHGNRSNTFHFLREMKADEFFQLFKSQQKLLMNAECCLDVLDSYAPNSIENRWAKQLKDKGLFRQRLSSLFPDYYYFVTNMKKVKQLSPQHIPFPVVIKPSKGYSSIGVHKVNNQTEFEETVHTFNRELFFMQKIYGDKVLNGENIIIEKWINGEEYAIDCYYDRDGKPVILNIFKHLFKDEYDTSDRIYYTSKQVITDIYDDVLSFLKKIRTILPFKNFPIHLEIRKNQQTMIPIEINPLRFAGAGTTDLGVYAYGSNSYKHYFQDSSPNWEQIIDQMDEQLYSFFCAEIPSTISKNMLKSIDHQSFQKEFQQLLAYRKIQASNDRTFSIVFFKSNSMEELYRLLQLDLEKYITTKEFIQSKGL